MELRNHTPGPASGALACSAKMGATRWTVGQWVARVAIGSVLLAVVGCGIGLLVPGLACSPTRLTQGRRAYDRGDWGTAARSAREILKARQDDPAALRLLARSSVQLGRDDAALEDLHPAPRGQDGPGRRLRAPGSGAEAAGTGGRRDVGLEPGTRGRTGPGPDSR